MSNIDTTPLLIKVPMELHRQFKASCIINGTSMTAVITEMMTAYINGKSTEQIREDIKCASKTS